MQMPKTRPRVASVVSEGWCEDCGGREVRFRLGILNDGPILWIYIIADIIVVEQVNERED